MHRDSSDHREAASTPDPDTAVRWAAAGSVAFGNSKIREMVAAHGQAGKISNRQHQPGMSSYALLQSHFFKSL